MQYAALALPLTATFFYAWLRSVSSTYLQHTTAHPNLMAQPDAFLILDSKLYPGVGANAPVLRPRLDPPETIVQGSCPVSCVVAPAGYGKSTLMAHWHQLLSEQKHQTLWLSLDADDNNCSRFLAHLITALSKVSKKIGKDALAQLANGQISSYKPLLESLAADIAKVDQRTILFLDDFQFIEEASVIEIVDWLIHYSPRQIQYVIGSRSEPALRLGTLRVRGQLHELSMQDLQFDHDETLAFYQSRLKAALSTEQLTQLLTKTEGWPAGLELAAHALKSESDREAFLASFTGTDHGIMEYLGEAVIQNLSPELRDFVYQIAQFDRITAPLASHVTGIADAASLLEELHARNLFLIPLDRQGDWFRFHHLVGEFFRDHFRSNDEARCNDVLTHGARWLWDNDFTQEAVNSALRASNWALASQWVEQYAEDMAVRRGDLQLVLGWINALPREWVDRYPRMRINYAFALSFLPGRTEVDQQLDYLKEARQKLSATKKPDTKTVASIDSALEFQHAMSLALDDQPALARDASLAWMDKWPEAPLLQRGVMGNVLAASYKGTGDIEAGLQTVDDAKRILKKAKGDYGLAWSGSVEALLLMKQGNYPQAAATCQRGLAFVAKEMGGHRLHASVYQAILANVHYEANELDKAAACMEQVLHSITEYGMADFQILATLVRARLHFSGKETDAGLLVLREGQELGHQRGLLRAAISLAAEECIWLCRLGRQAEAKSIAARYGFDESKPANKKSHPHLDLVPESLYQDKVSRVASRLIMQDAPATVAKSLKPQIQRCEKLGLDHRRVELLILLAIAQQQLGQSKTAALHLKTALEIAARHGYLRVFLDERQAIADILQQVKLAKKDSKELTLLLSHLIQATQEASSHQSEVQQNSENLIEDLTTRELHILQHLDSGLSNKEIADSIFISLGTLKWHLHNIYGKLGVSNRYGARVRAHDLKLLQDRN